MTASAMIEAWLQNADLPTLRAKLEELEELDVDRRDLSPRDVEARTRLVMKLRAAIAVRETRT